MVNCERNRVAREANATSVCVSLVDMIKQAMVVMGVLGLVGCSHTLGRARLNDGKDLVIEGRGSKTNVSVKCLTESEIKELTGSNINPGVAKASCYTVVFVSSDSSSISKAITAYARAETELNDKVASAVTDGHTPKTSSVGAELAKKVVAESLSQDEATVKSDASKLLLSLDPKTKGEFTAALKDISQNAVDPAMKSRLDAVVDLAE